MNKLKGTSKYIVIGIFLVVIFIIGLILGSLFMKTTVINASSKGISADTVAIVNEDVYVEYNGESLKVSDYYVNKLLQNNKYKYEVVTSSKAEQGLESGYYLMSLKFPSTFTTSVISVNEQVPLKVRVEYEINDKLNGEEKYELEKDVNYFSYLLNNSLNYIYTYGIFEGLHKTQNYVDDVIENNGNSIKYMNEIAQIDLLADHDYELKEENTDEFASVDIQPQKDDLKNVYATFNTEYSKNRTEYELQSDIKNTAIKVDINNLFNLLTKFNGYLKYLSTSIHDTIYDNDIFTPTYKILYKSLEKNYDNDTKYLDKQEEMISNLNKLNKKFTNIEKMFEAVNGDFENVKDNYNTIQGYFEKVNAKFDDIILMLGIPKGSYKNIENNFESVNQWITNIDKTYDIVIENYGNIDKNYGVVKETYNTIKGNYNDITLTYTTIKDKIEDLRKSFRDLVKNVEVIVKEFTDTSSENYGSIYDNLITSYDGFKENIKVIEEEIKEYVQDSIGIEVLNELKKYNEGLEACLDSTNETSCNLESLSNTSNTYIASLDTIADEFIEVGERLHGKATDTNSLKESYKVCNNLERGKVDNCINNNIEKFEEKYGTDGLRIKIFDILENLPTPFQKIDKGIKIYNSNVKLLFIDMKTTMNNIIHQVKFHNVDKYIGYMEDCIDQIEDYGIEVEKYTENIDENIKILAGYNSNALIYKNTIDGYATLVEVYKEGVRNSSKVISGIIKRIENFKLMVSDYIKEVNNFSNSVDSDYMQDIALYLGIIDGYKLEVKNLKEEIKNNIKYTNDTFDTMKDIFFYEKKDEILPRVFIEDDMLYYKDLVDGKYVDKLVVDKKVDEIITKKNKIIKKDQQIKIDEILKGDSILGKQICSNHTGDGSDFCQTLDVIKKVNSLQTNYYGVTLTGWLSIFDQKYFDDGEYSGDFIKIRSNGEKEYPTNIFAYINGYEYCEVEGGREYTQNGKCRGLFNKPKIEIGIFDGDFGNGYKSIIKDILDLVIEFKEVDPTAYQEKISQIEVDIDNVMQEVEAINNKLFDIKLDVFSQNQENMQTYVDEISEDPIYEKTIEKTLIEQKNDNKESEEKLSDVRGLLNNSSTGNGNNLEVYDFISNPVKLEKVGTSKISTIMENVDQSAKLRILFLSILIVLIPIISFIIFSKKNKGE